MAGLLAHSVWLSLVLGHSGVDGPALRSATAQFLSMFAFAYCTMSGRIGALKTFGRG